MVQTNLLLILLYLLDRSSLALLEFLLNVDDVDESHFHLFNFLLLWLHGLTLFGWLLYALATLLAFQVFAHIQFHEDIVIFGLEALDLPILGYFS